MARLPRARPRIAWRSPRRSPHLPALERDRLFEGMPAASGGIAGVRIVDARRGELLDERALEGSHAPVALGDGSVAVTLSIAGEPSRLRRLSAHDGSALGEIVFAGEAGRAPQERLADVRGLGDGGCAVRHGSAVEIRWADGTPLARTAAVTRILAAGEGRLVLVESEGSTSRIRCLGRAVRWTAERGAPAHAQLAGDLLVELDDAAQRAWLLREAPSERLDPPHTGDGGVPPLPAANVPAAVPCPPARVAVFSALSGALRFEREIAGAVVSIAASSRVVCSFTADAQGAALLRWTASGDPLARVILPGRSPARHLAPAVVALDDTVLLWADGDRLVCSPLASPEETVWDLDPGVSFRGPPRMHDVGLTTADVLVGEDLLVVVGEGELVGLVAA